MVSPRCHLGVSQRIATVRQLHQHDMGRVLWGDRVRLPHQRGVQRVGYRPRLARVYRQRQSLRANASGGAVAFVLLQLLVSRRHLLLGHVARLGALACVLVGSGDTVREVPMRPECLSRRALYIGVFYQWI